MDRGEGKPTMKEWTMFKRTEQRPESPEVPDDLAVAEGAEVIFWFFGNPSGLREVKAAATETVQIPPEMGAEFTVTFRVTGIVREERA